MREEDGMPGASTMSTLAFRVEDVGGEFSGPRAAEAFASRGLGVVVAVGLRPSSNACGVCRAPLLASADWALTRDPVRCTASVRCRADSVAPAMLTTIRDSAQGVVVHAPDDPAVRWRVVVEPDHSFTCDATVATHDRAGTDEEPRWRVRLRDDLRQWGARAKAMPMLSAAVAPAEFCWPLDPLQRRVGGGLIGDLTGFVSNRGQWGVRTARRMWLRAVPARVPEPRLTGGGELWFAQYENNAALTTALATMLATIGRLAGARAPGDWDIKETPHRRWQLGDDDLRRTLSVSINLAGDASALEDARSAVGQLIEMSRVSDLVDCLLLSIDVP